MNHSLKQLFMLKCNQCLCKKQPKNVAIPLGYFIFYKKNHNKLPKLAQLLKKITQSGHPVQVLNRTKQFKNVKEQFASSSVPGFSWNGSRSLII
jgi:hypothetical protein